MPFGGQYLPSRLAIKCTDPTHTDTYTHTRTGTTRIMKSLTLILLVGAIATAVLVVSGGPAGDKKAGISHKLKTTSTTTTSAPSSTSTKASTSGPSSTPTGKASATPSSDKCSRECPNDYNPICGSDGGKVNLSFGNKCVMEKYNCEHKANLAVKLNTECPNSKGIRLA